APQDSRMVSPWLLTTKWHKHTEGHDVDGLRKLVAFPKGEEPATRGLTKAVESYYQAATGLLEHTDELVLQRLNSPDPAKSGISNTPLHKHQEASTIKAYIFPAVSLLSMLLRLDGQEAYDLPLSEELEEATEALASDLAEEREARLSDSLHSVFMALWTRKWTRTEANKVPCPTERALALLTLERDGSYKEPKDVTGIIAKLEWCIRFACLQEIHRTVESEFDGEEEAACDALVPWFTEKTNSPFSRIRSLQHRATAIALQTMSMPRIWWTDRKGYRSMLYKGDKIELDALAEVFAQMEEKMVKLWEDKVMLGLKMRIDYDRIADDPTNTEVGYSFLTDARNTMFHQRDRLLRALLEDASTRGQVAAMRNGRVVWNKGALRRWLKDYAEYQSVLLARCEMLSGAPGRGTELTAMAYCNTRLRPRRNLCVLGDHLSMLRTYHKMGALTGLDKLIPHALDGVTADMLIQDLSTTRPFAEFAAHICFPDQPGVKELYQSHLFVNYDRLFDSEDLSHSMSEHTTPVLGFGLKINSWRHISTAFKRKLGRFAEELADEDVLETVDAQQAGHSKATENRVYGISPDALSGAAEDIIPLYLEASENWQAINKTVPGGRRLSYQEASCKNFDALLAAGKIGSRATTASPRGPAVAAAVTAEELAASTAALLMPMLSDLIQTSIAKALEGTQGRPAVRRSPTPPPQPAQETDYDSEDLYVPHPQPRPGKSTEVPLRHAKPSTPPSPPPPSLVKKALWALRVIVDNDEADWTTPAQGQAMTAVLEGQRDVVAVLRTGGGKSMLGILPSIVEDKITVIALPLKSLISDFARRLQKLRVKYQLYDRSVNGGRLRPDVNLVLVSADKARGDNWRQSLAEVNQVKTVARLIFDEAHLGLMSEDFRQSLRDLHELRQFPMQLVLLSGTVPPPMVEPLKVHFGLGANTVVIRECTSRPELEYIL
ncbi:hypothetical protein BV22DRAFT_985743, partial [Leucogyrophana mollusca]